MLHAFAHGFAATVGVIAGIVAAFFAIAGLAALVQRLERRK